MKRSMTRLTITTMCLAFLCSTCFTGCITVGSNQIIPDECAGSLIYPIKSEWALGAGVLKIGVLETLKRNPELKQPTLDVLNQLAIILGDPSSDYSWFAYVVINNVEELNKYISGPSLLAATAIITESFAVSELIIDGCDRDLLLRDISQLKLWVGML